MFRTVLDEARQNRTEWIKKIKIPVECLRFNFQTKTYVCVLLVRACYYIVMFDRNRAQGAQSVTRLRN